MTDILDNFAAEYPQYAAQGFQIAGFVWWQGHKDQNQPAADRYEGNRVRFIDSLRSYYGARYPGQISPTAPFVCATIAFGYYLLQQVCEYLTVDMGLAPVLGAWIPNLVYAVLAVALLLHARRVTG